MSMGFVKRTWLLTLAVFMGLASAAWISWGASYNFYFNNTEQGNNSTASPTLNVSGGTVTKTPAQGTAQQALTNAAAENAPVQVTPITGDLPLTAAPAVAPPAVNTQAATVMPPSDSFKDPIARFTLGSSYAYKLVNKDGIQRYSDLWGVSGSVGVFLFEQVGLNVFGGGHFQQGNLVHRFAGLELEIVPLSIGFGRMDKFVQLGLLVGGMSDESVTAPHIGSRLTVNLGKHWSLTGTARLTPNTVGVDAGLAILL